MLFATGLLSPLFLLIHLNLSDPVSSYEAYVGTWITDDMPGLTVEIMPGPAGLTMRLAETNDVGTVDWGAADIVILPAPVAQTGDDTPLLGASFVRAPLHAEARLRLHEGALELDLLRYGTRHDMGRDRVILRRKTSGTRSGKIYGSVIGEARGTASLFNVSLYGPDNGYTLVQRLPLNKDKGYSFEGLADGTYWLFVESSTPSFNPVQAYPLQAHVTISQGTAIVQHVELR
ncbi:MAG: hypothetical protein OHK0039_36410 [Bacteroidia bacterium]